MGVVEFDEAHFEKPVVCSAKQDPNELACIIASKHGVQVSVMLSKLRYKHLTKAREELYRELRSWGWSFPAIGHFCNRDHSTIMFALASPEERAARIQRVKEHNAMRIQ